MSMMGMLKRMFMQRDAPGEMRRSSRMSQEAGQSRPFGKPGPRLRLRSAEKLLKRLRRK